MPRKTTRYTTINDKTGVQWGKEGLFMVHKTGKVAVNHYSSIALTRKEFFKLAVFVFFGRK